MEEYYFIMEDNSKNGVPIDLEASIYEQFIEKEQYIKDYVFPPANEIAAWERPITTDTTVQMPEKLFLINKHKKIDFDMYYKDGGFIVSENFKKIIDSINHPQYVSSPLEIRTREGECNTKKEYCYIKFIERSLCLDFSKSDLRLNKSLFSDAEPSIYKYTGKVVVNSKLFMPKEFFWLNYPYINNYLYCNQETMEVIIKSKIKTVKVIEMENVFDYLPKDSKNTKLIIE